MLNNINELNDILHLLWSDKGNYPKLRMKHLLRIIDDHIAEFIALSLTEHLSNPLDVPFGKFQSIVQRLSSIHSEWSDVRNTDLLRFFKQTPKRWTYTDDECKMSYISKRIHHRMTEVLQIRTLYQQIQILHQQKFSTKRDVFAVLRSQEPTIWHCDDENERGFARSKKMWYKAMSKSIQASADKLGIRLKQISAQSPQLILAEFENFSVLLQQKVVAMQLKGHKEKLLVEMQSHCKRIQFQYERLLTSNEGFDIDNHPVVALSASCSRIMTTHRLKSNVEQLHEINDKLIHNEMLSQHIIFLRRDLGTLSTDLFTNWIEDQHLILSESGLSEPNRKVMELDLEHDGQLIVHFNDNLVAMIHDVRFLKEFGFSIPSPIQRGFETASSFYQYAVQLKQIANFYNTMSSQIVQSQKGLVLLEAQKFERVIKHKKAVTWDRPKECHHFIKTLMSASEELAQRNRRLRNLHHFIGDKMKQLLHLDLFADASKWKEVMDRIALVFERESKSNTTKAMAMWVMHWDAKLYKLFSFQFNKCITKIEDYLAADHVIYCNLIFDD